MPFFKAFRKNSPAKNPSRTFFKPWLLDLESRVTPAAFTGNVDLSAGALRMLITSTGVGVDANTIAVSNASSSAVLFDAGAGNTLTLTDTVGGLTLVGNGTNQVSVGFGGSLTSLNLVGNLGQDVFDLGSLNSAVALNTGADFGINIDSASVSSGTTPIPDSLQISGAVQTTGAGNFTTSNSLTLSQNLNQITIAATGSITAPGTGAVSLVANFQSGSGITLNSGGLIQTGTGSVDLTADNNTGRIQLAGTPIITSGGIINLNSSVVLQNSTTLKSGAASTGNINFNSLLDGNATVNPEDLTIVTGAVLNFVGNVGTTNPLGDIITLTNNPTGITANGSNGIRANSLQTTASVAGLIQIDGPQSYLTLAGLQLKTTGASGDIKLLDDVTLIPNATLSLNHSRQLLIGGDILNGVLTESKNGAFKSTVVLGDDQPITIAVNQDITFNTPVSLSQDATLTPGATGILFNSTLDGSRTLTLNTTGTVEFKGNVGSINPVSQILTLANPSNLDMVTVGTSLKAGVVDCTVAGNVNITVDQEYSGGGLNLTTIPGPGGAGDITVGRITSTIGSVGGVSISNSGLLKITKDIYLDGPFYQALVLQGFTITSAGNGYTSSPLVGLSGGGGSAAGATSLLSINTITSITNGGSGYLVNEVVTFQDGTGAGATALVTSVDGTGAITGISLSNIGAGYTNLIGLTVTGGTGTGAIFDASGFVNSIRVDNPGSGYNTPPTVSLTGGGGSGATADAILSFSTGLVELGLTGQPAAKSIIIDTNNQDIFFTSRATLNQNLYLNAGTKITSDVTLGAVDSRVGQTKDITLELGGAVTLNGSLGAVTPIGAFNTSFNPVLRLTTGTNATVINAGSLKTNVIGICSILATQNYTGTLDSSYSVTNPQILGLEITNTDSSAKVETGPITTTAFGTGQLSGVTITSAGNDYTLSPVVSFSGGGGSGAVANAFLSIQNILGITTNGTGYTAGQTVKILGGTASATALINSVSLDGGITSITIQTGGAGFSNLTSLEIAGGTGTGAFVTASGAVNSVTLVNPGSGFTSAPTAVFTNAAGDTTGSGAAGDGTLLTRSTPVVFNNAGPLNITGDLSVGGPISQIGTGSVFLGTATVPLSLTSTSGDTISFNAPVNLLTDTQINSNGGDITFNRQIDGSFTFTLNVLGGDVFAGDRIGFNPLGPITINDANGITLLGNVFADSMTIANGVGPVILSGSLDFTNKTITNLSITTITPEGVIAIQRPVTAENAIVINNAGTLTLTDIADIKVNLGSFTQTGAGGVILGGDITIPEGNITFSGSVAFSGNSVLAATNTDTPAAILFSGPVNGLGGATLESTGTITFNSTVGATNPVGTLIIRNSVAPLGGYATQFSGSLNASVLNIQNSSGDVRFLGSVIIQNQLVTSFNLYNLSFTGASTSIGGTANFINGGAVRLNNTTIFSGSASFSSAGTLEIGGTTTLSGDFSSARATKISSPLGLNLGSQNNKITGVLTGSGITLGGSGNLTLLADSPAYSSTIRINTGSLQVSAFYNNARVTIAGGTLLGSGQVSQVTGTSGTLSPGASLGTLGVTGSMSLAAASTFSTNIIGASAGSFGQVRASGAVTLGSSTLNIVSASNLTVGQTITLINKVGAGAINGTFSGLAEGASLKVGTTTFTISYIGGTGNDAVLTVTDTNINPPPSTGFLKFFAAGADAGGGPAVQINYVDGTNRVFYAYSSAYTGGVRVATGDVNGDGYEDLITGTGVGGGPHIKVFDLRGGTPVEVASFFAFEPTFMGGVNLATGNINGDAYADIIIGAGTGGGPRVKVFNGAAGHLVRSLVPSMDFFAYDPGFRGGVVVASGDRDADGVDDVITGAGVGGGPNVRSFNAAATMIDNFFAFSPNITTGIYVAAGYVNDDGIVDILVGTGRGTPNQIRAFYSPGSTGTVPTTVTANPFPNGFTGGARTGLLLNPDGSTVFGVAAGPGGAPEVRALNLNLATTDALYAINPLFYGGVFLNTTL